MAAHDGPVTSDVLAQAMDTNPVVIRRILAGLREQGYVHSEKGHGGGWVLAGDPAQITLRDIYTALGRPALLAIGNRSEAPKCLVEQAVNGALNRVFEEAEGILLARLAEVTLAGLSADLKKSLAARCQAHNKEVTDAL